MMKKKIIGIVGPTASGKTALSLPLAARLGGEILCMDSMQVYRHMDIGTAKPTAGERKTVPHHLLDIVSPFDAFSVSQYTSLARPLLETIPVPILVGGTGLYLQGLSQDMAYGKVGSDESIRARYHLLADTEGKRAVHQCLEKVDPVTAARLHENDIRRVIRALEVYELTGTPLSCQPRPSPEDEPYRFFLYAFSLPRETLYARCDARVDEMLKSGLLDEIRALKAMGVTEEHPSMQGLGYKELFPVLEGRGSLADAVSLIKLRTRHFAKRQLTWFRRDERIVWLDWYEDTQKQIDRIICDFSEE